MTSASHIELFDRQPLFGELARRGHGGWSEELREICRRKFHPDAHGTLANWIEAWEQLPAAGEKTRLECADDGVRVRATEPGDTQLDEFQLRQLLMRFHPWRKGPFEFFGLQIDTEWRSNLKWNRLADAVDFRQKLVLDVGCGNGYYGWRMLQQGAELVVGCDPYLLYIMQFEVFRRYAASPEQHFVVPLADSELPADLRLFDVALSMGVLYHRTSPIDHLQKMASTLRAGGELVLETLILAGEASELLVPRERYAKMRNVWFIPTLPLLVRWLERTGYRQIKVIDVSPTTTAEQRRTEWMTFESLPDFLDPSDPSLTIEGDPAPLRAMLIAQKA